MKQYLAIAALLACASVQAASLEVPIYQVSGQGTSNTLGRITITETEYGLLFTPMLKGLSAGVHGFHVHENGSCNPVMKEGKSVAALAAGGHFDPQKTGKHLGPYADGHLGDLPSLSVAADGTAEVPVLAPRLKKLSEITGRALMIHAGGDNHSDEPLPLGGGGARIACGVVK